ncbi:SDR family oxidoreductase [Modestobacter sp. L9-4]|uniref:SDR family oxidoreductase n=1 Tax=Modestobacter sp. L9-4 TaxID=2851567 RepID=UPI001C7812CA|nr:SDR family oxidoreductase [Modestobacter sp. L9-4]QXG74920.1 SDR family oxidoreductase [Modestobacter sp. L9-4]
MTGIDGKVVAITGASSGIGEATAVLLAERGARVALGARRADHLIDVAERITRAGGEVVHVPTDVRRRADLTALVAAAEERWGRLDVLVANAGVGHIAPLDELDVDGWEEMIDVNLKGVLFGVAAALPVFRRQGSGQFVTVVSTSGLRITPDQAVYAATKNAVRTFSEGLRQEAGAALRVSTVSPGFVGTDFAAGVRNPDVREQLLAQRDRIAIPPAAIARAIAYAIEQPDDVDVNEIVVRPTAQA